MITCWCIDDKGRPSQIPKGKWVKEGEKYRIHGLYVHPNQGNIRGLTLIEKPLDKTCKPFETFKVSRFAIDPKDIPELIQLARDCSDLNDLDNETLKTLLEQELTHV